MHKHLFAALLCVVQTLTGIHAQNVQISSANYPSEPSIRMDPSRPAHIVAGSVLMNVYYSSDTGRTWSEGVMHSPYGVWGDPVLDVDTSGHFYYFHLSNPPSGNWIDRIVCQKSTDHGLTWSSGTYTGLNGTKAQDKHWSVVDRTHNRIYLTWTQFDEYGSSSPTDSSLILFSRSADGGETWTDPRRINRIAGDCIDSDNTAEGAVPAVGPQGEVYVAWAGPGGIYFDRSTDGGDTWLEQDIFVDPMPGGWDYEIPGIDRCNGLPVTACDLINGPYRGSIYINWTDQRNGSDDTDVWLCRSTDGGNTWSAPVRVNDDEPGKHQFLTWMAVDQTNGNLYFVFYDRREHNDRHTDVYLAWSFDGGQTFTNRRISETPFLPVNGIFFGDYNNITVHNNIVRPVWTRLHNGQLSIWTDITPFEILTGSQPVEPDQTGEDFTASHPNPATDKVWVSFKLHSESFVNIRLYDQEGKCVYTAIEGKRYSMGRHVVEINTIAAGLKPGIYFCRMEYEGKEMTRKIVIAG